MDKVKELYSTALESLGGRPSLRQDWVWVTAICLGIYAVNLAFRMSFAGRWDHPELWVAGERLLATHDAYYWLARAKGVGEISHIPLALLTRFAHDFFGLNYGSIAFWGPAVLGSLTSIVCALWGWMLGGVHAALFAGLIGSLTPGFFYRSRLGYYDTDAFTLLGPLLVGWLLAYMVSRCCHSGWRNTENKEAKVVSLTRMAIMALCFGLIARVAGCWHLDITGLNAILSLLACAYVLVNGAPGKRSIAFYGLGIFIVTAFPGSAYMQYAWGPMNGLFLLLHSLFSFPYQLTGPLVGVVCTVLIVLLDRINFDLVGAKWGGAVFLVVVLVFTNILVTPFGLLFAKLSSYLPATVSATGGTSSQASAPVYPSVVQSIIETKSVSISEIFKRGAFWPWLGCIALLVSPIVVLFRSTAIFLLPLIALQLLSVKIGVRFTMFGGAALIILSGVSLHWLIRFVSRSLKNRNAIEVAGQLVCATAIIVYCFSAYGKLPLTPVLSKAYAEALIDLGKSGHNDGMIWTWWDWGYAQYYAGMETMVDGGKHSGKAVFPVALALSTDSPRQASQIIRYSSQFPAQNQQELGYDPALNWNKMTGAEVVKQIDAMRVASLDFPKKAPQYFVVSWNDLSVSRWITYFGNWNLETGQTQQANVSNYKPGEVGFNIQRGAIVHRDGRGGLVKDITVLSEGEPVVNNYFMNSMSPQLLPSQQHLLINTVSKQSILIDRIAQRSMAVKLMTASPDDLELKQYFKLVVDKLPFARIYEVVQ